MYVADDGEFSDDVTYALYYNNYIEIFKNYSNGTLSSADEIVPEKLKYINVYEDVSDCSGYTMFTPNLGFNIFYCPGQVMNL